MPQWIDSGGLRRFPRAPHAHVSPGTSRLFFLSEGSAGEVPRTHAFERGGPFDVDVFLLAILHAQEARSFGVQGHTSKIEIMLEMHEFYGSGGATIQERTRGGSAACERTTSAATSGGRSTSGGCASWGSAHRINRGNGG